MVRYCQFSLVVKVNNEELVNHCGATVRFARFSHQSGQMILGGGSSVVALGTAVPARKS